jgi:hypothetical protein
VGKRATPHALELRYWFNNVKNLAPLHVGVAILVKMANVLTVMMVLLLCFRASPALDEDDAPGIS